MTRRLARGQPMLPNLGDGIGRRPSRQEKKIRVVFEGEYAINSDGHKVPLIREYTESDLLKLRGLYRYRKIES